MLKNYLQLMMRSSFFLGLCVILFSCGSGKKSNDSASEEFKEATAEEIEQDLEEVVRELPPPSEIPFLLQEIGADFDESLVNDASKADSYMTTNDKMAANLGIYMADIGYLTAYQKAQEALNYVAQCKSMAENLDITNEMGQRFVERFERNVSDRDSLEKIVNDFIYRSDKDLKTKERETTAALILTGSFVEGLYLATAIIENYPEDILPEDARMVILVPIIRLVLDQEEPLNDLIDLLKELPNQDNEMVKGLISNLQYLSEKYAALNIEDKLQNDPSSLLTNQTLDDITNQTGKIRDYITNVNS